ncbi:MAG: cytochrome P450 [Myxococcales bacterium]|nr:cytochrome P450 [Myxococcales bacterium]
MSAPALSIPTVPGAPLVGNALQLARDPFGFLRRCYREHGAAFELDLAGQRTAVFAGPESNLLLKQHEHTHFAAAPSFQGLSRALDTKRFLMTLDGDVHRQLRSALGPAVAHKQLESYLPALESIARRSLDQWCTRGVFDVRKALKRMVYTQLGGVLASVDAEEFYDDVVRVFDTALRVGLTRVWPAFMKHNPWNLRSRRRLRVLAERLMASAGDGVQIPDLVKRAVADGVLPPDDLLATLLAPYFAGIDTVASSLSFAFYAVAAQPEQAQRVRDELDGLSGPLTIAALRQLPTLRSFVLETLRCYPVTMLSLRHTTHPVEHGGARLPAHHPVAFAVSLPHKLEEYFPEPDVFDLDRFPGGRSTAPPGVFQPFGTGRHVCLGAGLADIQMLVVLATLLRDYDFTLEPNYRLRLVLAPLPAPKKLRGRLTPRTTSRLHHAA